MAFRTGGTPNVKYQPGGRLCENGRKGLEGEDGAHGDKGLRGPQRVSS